MNPTLTVPLDPAVRLAIEMLDQRGDLSTLWVFGSHAKGTARSDSDLDLAALFARPINPLELADLAADLSQETYRRAWTALANFDRRARFSTWLFRIAYTTFLNHLRRPRRFIPLEERHEAFYDPSPSAEDALRQAMAADRLRRAVLALPEDLRFTVTAVYWGELPTSEVARHEGITGVAVRKRLKRALGRLALELGGESR